MTRAAPVSQNCFGCPAGRFLFSSFFYSLLLCFYLWLLLVNGQVIHIHFRSPDLNSPPLPVRLLSVGRKRYKLHSVVMDKRRWAERARTHTAYNFNRVINRTQNASLSMVICCDWFIERETDQGKSPKNFDQLYFHRFVNIWPLASRRISFFCCWK